MVLILRFRITIEILVKFVSSKTESLFNNMYQELVILTTTENNNLLKIDLH